MFKEHSRVETGDELEILGWRYIVRIDFRTVVKLCVEDLTLV